MPLCPPEAYDSANWNGGRYVGNKPESKGQLEHFNSQLKAAKGWLWDNFFMVDSDVNTKVKRRQLVDSILKPDREDYDEFALLEYSSSLHMFVARTSIPLELQERINAMIETLGINFGIVRHERRQFLMEIVADIKFGSKTWDNVIPYKFPTAFEMMKREYNPQNIVAVEEE